MTNNLGIYIHIPYCISKCRYCDFLSYTSHDSEGRAYYTIKLVDELLGKSVVYGKNYTVNSIFIGGGTPSLLETEFLEEIMDVVFSRYKTTNDCEITIEANPGTLNSTKLSDYLGLGINRLSMGVQSLNDDILKYLGRIHTKEDAIKNYFDARKAGFENINLDMMFAIPGQTVDVWNDNFKDVIDLSPDHISFYSLQIEDKTPIFAEIMDGKVKELDPVTDRKMYHNAVNMLDSNGYHHYEISNAAKKGFESIHNLKYWSMDDYIGVGLGAHSYIKGNELIGKPSRRFSNTEILKDYLSNDVRDGLGVIEHDSTMTDNMGEYVFLGLRKIDGISLKAFENTFGKKFLDLYGQETEEMINRGLLEQNGDNLRLTELGIDLSNQVFVEYV